MTDLNRTDLAALKLAIETGSLRLDAPCFKSELAATRCIEKLWRRLDYLKVVMDDEGDWLWKPSPWGRIAYRQATGYGGYLQ